MDPYPLLKYAHILGFVLLGGGLLAVFVTEFEAYRTRDLRTFAEAARYTAVFYDALAVPGALLVGLTGLALMLDLGLGFFEAPWTIGMWSLFLFEFIEGNTVTRIQFRRTLRRSRAALAAGAPLTDDLRDDARSRLNQVVHFLDLPLFSVIVYCGTARPATWTDIGLVIAIALAATVLLTVTVPRIAARLRG